MRPRNALLGAGGCLLALALVWFAAFHVGPFRHTDRSAFVQFYDLQGHGSIAWLVRHLVRPFDPNPYVFLVPVPMVVALASAPPGVVLLGASVLGIVLVITHPHDVVSYARVHQAFVLEGAGIAALSLAVSTAVLLSVRR